MKWLRNLMFKMLKIKPAIERKIVIKEPLSFQGNVLKNQIWYRGDPAELEQFFKQAAVYDVDKTRFWASVPYRKVRKIHSGIVSIVIDRFKDIVVSDLDDISFGEEGENCPLKDEWEEIAKDNEFDGVIGSAVAGALSSGDGAFKISVDRENRYPTIDFYESDRVDFIRSGRKVSEVKFYTKYEAGTKEYNLEETYGRGYVRYKLFDESGKELPLNEIEETKELADTNFNGDFMMAVPLIIFTSSKWPGRGKALFDAKTDNLDALDEVISQWLDAVRMGRVKRYIPEDLVPRDPHTGELIEPNAFDNDYIAIGALKTEGAQDKIDISQPQISYEAYVNSYMSYLDLVLQGVISPSTLGIDLKKTDNAESQREKEKITLHTRNKIIDAMNKVIPQLVETTMKVYDLMYKQVAGDYEVSIKFGEYASPDFDSTVDVVGKAKNFAIMSTEKAVDELYGDTMTEDEKAEEVRRIKEEQGITEMEEPAVNQDAGFKFEPEGEGDESQSSKPNIPDEPEGIPGAAEGGQ
ncbi:capsid protein [Ihubacter massiliensis]|uniref:capsid protein n=1 Tax=Ihubacter massiliensis TaxID=1852367 RepID=UPI002097C7CE|nr:capsid protein [Ihubacter massiliensis]MCO7122038.1 capsid protein [Ihubacter massiliensis]